MQKYATKAQYAQQLKNENIRNCINMHKMLSMHAQHVEYTNMQDMENANISK